MRLRLGAKTVGRATDVFRAADADGDGVPHPPGEGRRRGCGTSRSRCCG